MKNQSLIESYLVGLDYPCNKEKIIEHIKQNGAVEEVVNMLKDLPDKEYRSSSDIASELDINSKEMDEE
ncbi:MAG: DUF2795 domain-containing protein [Candidatus Pacebacteria bacterium]|nr:DUF2795 domain-containing protein [Candidatus Paceibacterota bacterium]